MLAQNTHTHFETQLRGKRILLVEDEYYIADDVCRLLQQAGAIVIGPAATIEAAHVLVDVEDFDCAVLDLNLHGESALAIADRLDALGRSFVIATGYGSPSVPDRLRHTRRGSKNHSNPRRCSECSRKFPARRMWTEAAVR